MSSPIYIINDWDRNFEVSESRKIKNLSWVAFPNRHDSAPFRRVAALQNSPEIFAAWVLIVQIASKMPVRGVLENSTGPLTPEDLSLMTGFPEKCFADAFAALQKPGIKWISTKFPSSQEIFPARPGTSGSVGATGQDITGQDTTKQKRESATSLLSAAVLKFWKAKISNDTPTAQTLKNIEGILKKKIYDAHDLILSVTSYRNHLDELIEAGNPTLAYRGSNFFGQKQYFLDYLPDPERKAASKAKIEALLETA